MSPPSKRARLRDEFAAAAQHARPQQLHALGRRQFGHGRSTTRSAAAAVEVDEATLRSARKEISDQRISVVGRLVRLELVNFMNHSDLK